MQNLAEILNLAEVQAAPMGLLVVDTRLCQQGKRRILEVSICRKGGRISLTDCEELSRKLEQVLDEQEPPLIEGSYMLEVQSPGLDRQLKTEREIAIFAGEMVEVKTKDPIPSLQDNFIGILDSLSNGVLHIAKPQALSARVKPAKKHKAKAAATAAAPEKLEIDWSRVSSLRLYPVEPAAGAIPYTTSLDGQENAEEELAEL